MWGLLNVATEGINIYRWASSGKFSLILKHLKDERKTFRRFQYFPIKCLFLDPLVLCVREGSIFQMSAIISPSFLICLLWYIQEAMFKAYSFNCL